MLSTVKKCVRIITNYGISSRRKTIITEKTILSPSIENVEQTLFPVGFDVDFSLGIEVTLTNMH